MENTFHSQLKQYAATHDVSHANRVVMEELGRILIHDRNNFITLLRYADIPVKDDATDAHLIDKFIHNIDLNHKLLIGSAFLANQHNKQMGFDGEEKPNDEGIKTAHQVMFSYFDSGNYEEEQSNATGDIVSTVANAASQLAQVAGKGIDARQKKKYFASDILAKKEDAKQQMIASVLEQRRLQQEAVTKAQEAKAKQKKIIIIASVSLVGLIVIVAGIYYIKHKK